MLLNAMQGFGLDGARLRGLRSTLIVLMSLMAGNAGAQDRSLNPQYGFAHRVNTAAYIDEALDKDLGGGNAAATGIEFDVTYSNVHSGWFVSHGDAAINPGVDPTLAEWLQTLKGHLNTGKYDATFAVLWVDIKTANEGSLSTVINLVRANVPASVSILYGLNDVTNFDSETTGYDTIKSMGLLPNEGIACWAKDIAHVDRFYRIIQRDQIARAICEHGHALNINDDILTEINKSQYRDITNPYRFKKTFTWTNDLESSMNDYTDPSPSSHTDGQIVGAPASEYLPHYGDLEDFANAVADFSDTQRIADRLDAPSFWERSDLDYVSGALIYVNQAAAGARQTGARYQPIATVWGGMNAASLGARIVISPVAGSSYTNVTRLDKRARLEKAAGPGVARITK